MKPTAAARSAAEIVRDAGGSLVGRTRLQKVGYLRSAAGFKSDFSFVYKHYGPFSEELAQSAKVAQALGMLQEDERAAAWGGTYSDYRSLLPEDAGVDPDLSEFSSAAAKADAVELELAATAVFLWNEGIGDAWGETARRKPEKAESGRLERAKLLYESLRKLRTPAPLPDVK